MNTLIEKEDNFLQKSKKTFLKEESFEMDMIDGNTMVVKEDNPEFLKY